MSAAPAQNKQPARVLKVDSGHQAFAVKLKGFLHAHDEDDKQRRRTKGRWAIAVLAGVVALGYLGYLGLMNDIGFAPLAFVAAIITLVFGLNLLFEANAKHDELARARQVEAFFDAVRPDLHPRTTVKSRIDLGEATDTSPERHGTSPYSGASKHWYRHTWLDLRWAFADGNYLSLSLTDLVKTKSGSEIRREHQVKGELWINPDVYRDVRKVRLRSLKMTMRKTDKGWHIWFWGVLKSHDDLIQELKLLNAALEPLRGVSASA
jgi:hypothetical protein